MTKRERYLSMIIGGLLALFVLQWGINRYRTAVRTRTNRITLLRQENTQQQETMFEGELAEIQIGEYVARSLPGNRERAQSDYQSWLLDMLNKASLSDPRVNPTSITPVGDLYDRFSYSVDGRTDLPNLIELLHSFYAKDYLHGISKMTISPARDNSDNLDVKMSIDVLALAAAPIDAKSPASDSWRVAAGVLAYREPILNRNFFQPPNQAPVFTGNKTIEAIVGKASTTPLTFKDPDGHKLTYELIDGENQADAPKQVVVAEQDVEADQVDASEQIDAPEQTDAVVQVDSPEQADAPEQTDAPEQVDAIAQADSPKQAGSPTSIQLDSRTGTLTIRSDEKREFEVRVRVADDGYPSRVVEETLLVRVVDPPVQPPAVEKLKFDDAKQTVLTALVQGRENWTAWMNIRTRGKTLKLSVGDEFEIGSLKGSVIEVTPKYVILESKGQRFELRPPGNLEEAARSALEIKPSEQPSEQPTEAISEQPTDEFL